MQIIWVLQYTLKHGNTKGNFETQRYPWEEKNVLQPTHRQGKAEASCRSAAGIDLYYAVIKWARGNLILQRRPKKGRPIDVLNTDVQVQDVNSTDALIKNVLIKDVQRTGRGEKDIHRNMGAGGRTSDQ